jgi:hypothetical protein
VNFSPNIHREIFFGGSNLLTLEETYFFKFSHFFLVGKTTILFFLKKNCVPKLLNFIFLNLHRNAKNKTTLLHPLHPKHTHSLTGKSKTQNTKTKKKEKKIEVMMTRLTRPERRCADYYTNKQHPNNFLKTKGPG